MSTADAILEEPLEARVRRGANPRTPAGDLGVLARDPVSTVRGAVALNPSSSATIDLQLATDEDERVRLLLAHKVARLLPHIHTGEAGELDGPTYDLLATLVRDEGVRVRTIIAQVAASLPDLPRDLMLLLAQDSAIPVSEPVLRLSPLLSTAALLALLQAPPHAVATTAIARRADLPDTLTDSIAASTDSEAIRTMLANPSAAIRERTLDLLVARAAAEPGWHDPLVHRPTLPDRAARTLSEIVATHLIRVLADRKDLSAETLAEINRRLRAALSGGGSSPAPAAAQADEALMADARRMKDEGTLDEGALMTTLRSGDRRRAAARLAVAAGVPIATIDHAAALRSTKAFVSLVWKAGFTMRVAGPVQMLLADLSPAAALAAGGSAAFPLTPEEMEWQLGFLSRRVQ